MVNSTNTGKTAKCTKLRRNQQERLELSKELPQPRISEVDGGVAGQNFGYFSPAGYLGYRSLQQAIQIHTKNLIGAWFLVDIKVVALGIFLPSAPFCQVEM